MIQYSTTKQYIGMRQILLNHLSANEYNTITSANHYLPQHGKCKHHRERCDVDMYNSIIGLIPHDWIERRVGGVYENNWSC